VFVVVVIALGVVGDVRLVGWPGGGWNDSIGEAEPLLVADESSLVVPAPFGGAGPKPMRYLSLAAPISSSVISSLSISRCSLVGCDWD